MYISHRVFSFITRVRSFSSFASIKNNGITILTETTTSKGPGHIIFYFIPANNWWSHVKYCMANLIQRVALLVAKIYTRVLVVGAEKTAVIIKTWLCRIQSSCWQIVITPVSKERALQFCVFGETTMFQRLMIKSEK